MSKYRVGIYDNLIDPVSLVDSESMLLFNEVTGKWIKLPASQLKDVNSKDTPFEFETLRDAAIFCMSRNRLWRSSYLPLLS